MTDRAKLRAVLCQSLGQVLTPDLAAYIETQCCPFEVGFQATTGILHDSEMSVKIDTLVEQMLCLPQVECPVREYFAPGLYAREITIPKGAVIVGAVHRTQNMAVLSRGRLRLVTDSGSKEIEAHHVMTVNPGGRNAAVALEDSIWTNYHPTDETDPEKLVAQLTYATRDQLAGGPRNPQLLSNGGKQIQIGG